MAGKTAAAADKSKASARERLLETAIDVFGTYGYEAATTRMIAREAGVNISSIPYYFDGKEGLYRAMIQNFVALINLRFCGIEKEIAATDFSGADARDKAAARFEELLGEFIRFLIGSPQALRMGRVILREQLDPSAAYDLIYEGFMESIIGTMTSQIMVMAEDLPPRSAKLRAVAILGQIIVFRFARETVVRAVAMEGYSEAETDEVREIILAHTRAIMATL
jgi:AcrR family transcriptional regulator